MDRILIANPKGGVGKSTIATNLAGWYAKSGKKIMLGDVDRQQSSRAWLSIRSPALPIISTWHIEPGKPAKPPADSTHVVLDSPAGLHGKKLAAILRHIDRVIVPIQPSLFDIFATQQFLADLLASKQYRKESMQVAIVGVRVDAHTHSMGELERFLEGTRLPVIAQLRDTQNYVQAAAHGMSIFDLPAAQATQDWQQWIPLLRWASPLL